jgi:hypothetical protein
VLLEVRIRNSTSAMSPSAVRRTASSGSESDDPTLPIPTQHGQGYSSLPFNTSTSYISSTSAHVPTSRVNSNRFLSRANLWAKEGIETTVAAYSHIHDQLGLPPLVAGMWRRTLVRMCQDAGIIVSDIFTRPVFLSDKLSLAWPYCRRPSPVSLPPPNPYRDPTPTSHITPFLQRTNTRPLRSCNVFPHLPMWSTSGSTVPRW